METIINYLDNIFKTLPQTEEMVRVKNELQSDMQAKYNDLIQKDKTENEAIGIVIEEFGNIDELLYELGIQIDQEEELPVLNLETAKNFLSHSIKKVALISLGVTLIISGVAIMLAMYGYMQISLKGDILNESILPVIALLLIIIPAVGIFIYTGSLSQKYKFIEEGEFSLDNSCTKILKEEYETFAPKKTRGIIIGVGLCISAVIIQLLFTNLGEPFASYDLSIMLLVVAVAVFLFIYFGGIATAYEQLLKLNDYSPEKQKANKRVESVEAIIWPIVICIFLVWGFIFDGWNISWILFPIAVILLDGFADFKNK